MAENIQSQNPLSAYFRAPKLYTTIPRGWIFIAGYYDYSDNGERAVFPMTTKDGTNAEKSRCIVKWRSSSKFNQVMCTRHQRP